MKCALESMLKNPPLKRIIKKVGGSLVVFLGKEECNRRKLREKDILIFSIIGAENGKNNNMQ